MIKSKGTYQFSKDGGKTWLKVPNMLVKGYYNTQERSDLYIGIGSNGNEPTFSNTTLPAVLQTYNSDGLEVINFETTTNEFLIHNSQTFNFGTGHSFTARDIGMSIGSSRNALASRSLFKDSDGNPIDIEIIPDDVISVKYTLTYILPRAPTPVTVNFNGMDVTGTLRICNPNKWGNRAVGLPVSVQGFGVASEGTWSINESGFQTSTSSGIQNHSVRTSREFTNSKRTYRYYQNLGVDNFNHTFQQIAFSSGSFSGNNIVVLIDLDVPITNTPDDEFTVGINIIQEYINDSQQS